MPVPVDPMAVATIGSSIFNAFSQNTINDTNARIARENREWQSRENVLNRDWQTAENANSRYFTSRENQLGRDWEEKMWNLQNQYNTPSAMMARYREAGLNPFLNTQVGPGAGAASPVPTPNTSSTAPMGSPSMSGAPSAIPMVAPHFDLAGALGVSANIANQNANTLKTKWDIYNSILENGDRETAKRFLHANPDMMSDADPENSPFFKRYQTQNNIASLEEQQRNFEFWLRQQYGIKQTDAELYKLKSEADNLQSLISKRSVEVDEINASIRKINEQIKTEKSLQHKNYAEGDLAAAKAKTEDESRQYVVRQLLLQSGIMEHLSIEDQHRFDSMSAARAWLRTDEAKIAMREAAIRAGITNASYPLHIFEALLSGTSVGVHN